MAFPEPQSDLRRLLAFLFVERKMPETFLLEAATTKKGSRFREVQINLDTNVLQSRVLARQAVGMVGLELL